MDLVRIFQFKMGSLDLVGAKAACIWPVKLDFVGFLPDWLDLVETVRFRSSTHLVSLSPNNLLTSSCGVIKYKG